MQVLAMARARAATVTGVLVDRTVSSSTPFHRRTGSGPTTALRAGAEPSETARHDTTSVSVRRRETRLALVRHEDMAHEELAAEAALSGGDGRRSAHGVVLVPERRREMDVEAVTAGVHGLLEAAVGH